ncbi:hypothetical protein [Mycobacteroides abscessus]
MTSAKRTLAGRVADIVSTAKPGNDPIVVGITGIDTSGKTTLSTKVADSLRSRNKYVVLVHVDDFHNQRSERYVAGIPEPVQYYRHSINFDKLITQILKPIKLYGELDTVLTLLDLHSDSWTLERRYTVRNNTVVLVEGVFLLRPEVRPWIDLMIYVDVSEPEVLKRAKRRDVPIQGRDVMRKYATKYLPAQREYLKEHPPREFADLIINNDDWTAPVLLARPTWTKKDA